MFDSPGNQGHSLGLSIGATNVAATHDGRAVIHPSEVALHGQRLSGFVDRVGDPVPLVAPDGSHHRPEQLLAQAIGTAAQSATGGMRASETAITVPAHWRPSVVDTVRHTVGDGTSVVSDATAALTALSADPGLPTRGVILLCDFGGSGSSITLANASSNYAVVGETVRFADFSGDQIDQALLTHVVAGFTDTATDPSGTAMVGSLTSLRDECRRAKERLSAETATAVTVELPGQRTDVRVTRTELEGLIEPRFSEFLAALENTLEHYGIPQAGISAVATFGGSARIPLITQRLSEHLREPVVTTAHPQLTAAEGATLIAARSRVVETATTVTPVTPAAGLFAPTDVFDAGQPSTTLSALAWSDDEAELPYAVIDSRPELRFEHREPEEDAPPRRAPIVLFAVSATAVALTAAVFGLMQLAGGTTPVEAATTVAPSPAPAAPAPSPTPPAPQATKVTTVVVKPAQRANPQPRYQAPPVTEIPPAPPPPPPPPAPWTPPVWTPPTWTPPTWTPPWKLPPTPPSSPPVDPPPPVVDPPPSQPVPDPGPGDGATDKASPAADSDSDSDSGTGESETATGTGTQASAPEKSGES